MSMAERKQHRHLKFATQRPRHVKVGGSLSSRKGPSLEAGLGSPKLTEPMRPIKSVPMSFTSYALCPMPLSGRGANLKRAHELRGGLMRFPVRQGILREALGPRESDR